MNRVVSDGFIKKAKNCGIMEEYHEMNWLWKMIQSNADLREIADAIIGHNEYDGNCFTDTTSALMESYLTFKSDGRMDRDEKNYLKNRAGIIAIVSRNEKDDDPNDFIITCLDLISELDDDNFVNWLRK
jgi:hypothetical protein